MSERLPEWKGKTMLITLAINNKCYYCTYQIKWFIFQSNNLFANFLLFQPGTTLIAMQLSEQKFTYLSTLTSWTYIAMQRFVFLQLQKSLPPKRIWKSVVCVWYFFEKHLITSPQMQRSKSRTFFFFFGFAKKFNYANTATSWWWWRWRWWWWCWDLYLHLHFIWIMTYLISITATVLWSVSNFEKVKWPEKQFNTIPR